MILRYLTLCDKHGQKTEPMLQYWSEEDKHWLYIPEIECKTWEEDNFNEDPRLFIP